MTRRLRVCIAALVVASVAWAPAAAPQVDYAWGKPRRPNRTRLMDENGAQDMRTLLVRGGYLAGRSLGDQGQEYMERTMFTELHVRIPLKGGVLVSHRLRTDLRWLGDEPEFSTR